MDEHILKHFKPVGYTGSVYLDNDLEGLGEGAKKPS